MRTQTQLSLIRALQARRKATSSAFTLVELMIVVAVIGILSAVALPQYLQARNAAAAGSAVGEAIGLAKECAVYLSSGGVGVAPTQPTGMTVTCATGASGSVVSKTFGSGSEGIKCLDTTLLNSATSVTVTIPTNASISCS